MPSGKTVKLILYEVLQFAALIIPVLVVMERFAIIIHNVKGQDLTAYWLVVAISIAYVTSMTLVVWVPLKYLVLKQRINTQWRPTALVYIILCTFPCFALIITSSKVQVDSGHRSDQFTELPVSLVLFSLICVDIIERIRPCRLTGQSDSLDPDLNIPPYPILTHLEQVTTVSGQLHSDETQSLPETRNGRVSGRWQDNTGSPSPSTLSSRAPSTTYLYSSRPQSYPGRLGFLWRRDERSQVFVDSFLFWLDTVEMVRVAGEPPVFYSAWVFPIYIFAFLSTLRIAVTPNNPLLSSAGVALQDLPFFIIRFALLIVFGYVTPVLYPLKNALVSLTFVYFTLLSKLRIFRGQSMF
ncbi:transmembrane protein 236 [Mastacembelus armatus]|uniref:Transmembrane protein 236 n=1 Tax=Mastacembelus armatus TaxID=205130 RepID=A0A3Q3KKL7_9TELE|nr:transmembrane protein 236-like [Mastacembelus armatus]